MYSLAPQHARPAAAARRNASSGGGPSAAAAAAAASRQQQQRRPRCASAAAACPPLIGARSRCASCSALAAAAPGSEAAAAHSTSSSSKKDSGGSVERRVLTASKRSDLVATARLLIQQLDAFGAAELWATGAAGQFAAFGVLVTAQEMLARRGAGLAATLQLAPPDGDFDNEKRSMRKLVVGAVAAPPPRPEEWSAPELRTSTKRVRAAPDLAAALRRGLDSPAAGAVLEARGEQGVLRALRGLFALQAELGEPLAVWPWYGAVSDQGEEDGQSGGGGGGGGDVPGTVLLVRRMGV